MGVADVGALVDALTSARGRGLDLGSGDALRPYERDRRPANDGRLMMTDTMNRVFSNDLAPLAMARGLALKVLDRAGPLKRLAVRHGMQVG
jgi:2-polyprenyl-6-methoxyphenol hydroxylase-like FAD-dependent oxidoreductase